MEREELLKIAVSEARKALELEDKPGWRFERRGLIDEWEEGLCKNIFDVNFRIWEPIALVNTELDAGTGEITSWQDRAKIHESGEGVLAREKAIQIAEANVEVPAGTGIPEVNSVMEDGRSVTLVTWFSGRFSTTAEPVNLEVMINPSTGKICGIRRY